MRGSGEPNSCPPQPLQVHWTQAGVAALPFLSFDFLFHIRVACQFKVSYIHKLSRLSWERIHMERNLLPESTGRQRESGIQLLYYDPNLSMHLTYISCKAGPVGLRMVNTAMCFFCVVVESNNFANDLSM